MSTPPTYPARDHLPAPYGMAPPLAGTPFGMPPQRPRAGTNGFAIASLVLGILGGLVITVVLSAIFGIVALRQIKERGQGGRGMAISGLALSGAWLVAIGALVVTGPSSNADRDSDGDVSTSGRVSSEDLKVGDCFDDVPDDGVVYSVNAVPCAQPHDAEVVASVALPAGDYPGEDEIHQLAIGSCWDQVIGTVADDQLLDRLEIATLAPTRLSWSQGDRTVLCIAATVDGEKLTEPVSVAGLGTS